MEQGTSGTRVCYKCKETRPLEMFYLAAEARRGLREGRRKSVPQPCRHCQRATNQARTKPRQDYCDAIKLASGCVDCGIKSTHAEIYDFDHLPGAVKIANVARFTMEGTMDDLKAEIAKCEVVCANCHRIRTRQRPTGRFGRDQTATAASLPAQLDLSFDNAADVSDHPGPSS